MTQGRRKGVKRRRKATRLLWSTGPKSRSQIKERAQENTVEQSEHMIRAMLRENFQVINTQGYVWCYVPVFLACWCWDRWAMGLPVLQREFKNIRETWRHPVSKQQQYPDSSVWRRQKDGKTFWKAVNNVCVYVCACACVYCPCTHVCYLCMSACVCVHFSWSRHACEESDKLLWGPAMVCWLQSHYSLSESGVVFSGIRVMSFRIIAHNSFVISTH